MTQQELNKLVGKELTKHEYKLDKTIFGGYVYFFKKELLQDHYMYVPDKSTLYVIKHNPDNYNDSITETGKFPDSFKFKFDDALSSSIIELVILPKKSNDFAGGGPTKEWAEELAGKKGRKLTLIDKIDNIILELTDIKAELKNR